MARPYYCEAGRTYQLDGDVLLVQGEGDTWSETPRMGKGADAVEDEAEAN